MTTRRIIITFVIAGLAAGLVIATLPLRYEAQPDRHSVGCGPALVPTNPPPPPPNNDECDAAHVRAWILIISVFLASAVLGVVIALFRAASARFGRRDRGRSYGAVPLR
jgi:hypothetical protein